MKIVINVKCQKQFDEVNKILSKKAKNSLNSFQYSVYKKKTCIILDIDLLRYSHIEYFIKKGYQIKSYKEFINEYKNNEIVKTCKCGEKLTRIDIEYTSLITCSYLLILKAGFFKRIIG